MKTDSDKAEVFPMFAVMKALSFSSLSVGPYELHAPEEGPHRFIPVFLTREQAVKWNDGSEDNIFAIHPRKENENYDF